MISTTLKKKRKDVVRKPVETVPDSAVTVKTHKQVNGFIKQAEPFSVSRESKTLIKHVSGGHICRTSQ